MLIIASIYSIIKVFLKKYKNQGFFLTNDKKTLVSTIKSNMMLKKLFA